MTDDELLSRLEDLSGRSRRVEAELVAHLAEVDGRRLYAREACASMFVYCTERLHFSDAEAYLRIAAARASRRHPVLLEMLRDGRLHLSAIERLAPHLTIENRDRLLARAAHRSKRAVEELVAALSPRPDVVSSIRKLPAPGDAQEKSVVAAERRPAGGADAPGAASQLRPDGVSSAELVSPQLAALQSADRNVSLEAASGAAHAADCTPARRVTSTVEPLGPDRYRVQFTASSALREKLDRLRALMRRSVPDGDLATIIDGAVTEKLGRLEARRNGYDGTARPQSAPKAHSTGQSQRRATAPRPSAAGHHASEARSASTSRYIPAAVRRAVWQRDAGRCRYLDGHGRRCAATDRLEFHHRHPWGYGGRHEVDNICLICPTHNRYLGEVDYGRGRRRTTSGPAALAQDGGRTRVAAVAPA